MMPTLLTAAGLIPSRPAAIAASLAQVNTLAQANILAQVPEPVLETPEEASLVFSGPNFFITLLAGIVLAFAFQFLLTNLGVAAGVSLVSADGSSSGDSDDDSLGDTISKIGFTVGIVTLITVVVSLFCAVWLAVQLSLLVSPGLGAVVGLVIWAAYFSLLLWISSTTVGSLVGSVVNTATSGVQAIFGTAASVFQTNINDGMVATAEAAAAAVRRELSSTVDSDAVQEQLEDYIRALRSPDLDMAGLRAEFEAMIDDSGIAQSSEGEALPQLEREDFIQLVDDRTDLSNRDRDRIADQLYAVWTRRASRYQGDRTNARLMDYVQQASADQLTGSEFNQKLDQLIRAIREEDSGRSGGSASLKRAVTQPISATLNSMAGIVMGRTDLSDISVEKILSQLKSAQSQVSDQAQQLASDDETYNVIREDAKSYLLNTYHWRMTPDRVAREFRDIIYDPNADP
ncbi:MAG: MFS transporter, partial [Elainellaceae cyanobacterium]